MNSNLFFWQIGGFTASTLVGTFLHFLYDLTNQSILVAPFSAVNESTWEHMKILFFPMFAFAIIEYFFMKEKYPDFWCVKLKGTLLGVSLIPILFYTYNGVFGTSSARVNVIIFFLSSAIAYIWETKNFNKQSKPCVSTTLAIVTLCIIAILFAVFTFFPPEIPLFLDPVSQTYGISA